MKRVRYTGEAAVNKAVYDLLNKFEYPDVVGGGGLPLLGGGGGAPSIVVAASDAPDAVKAKADIVAPGVNDDEAVATAEDLIDGQGGRILLTEGTFYFTSTVLLSSKVSVVGMGMAATAIETTDVIAFTLGGYGNISDLTITTGGTTAGCISVSSGGVCSIRDLLLYGAAYGVSKTGSAYTVVERCYIFSDATDGVIVGSGTGDTVVRHNYIWAGTSGVDLVGAASNTGIIIQGNYFGSSTNVAVQSNNSQRVVIADNILDTVSQHGISGTGLTDSVIEGNLIYRPGTGTDNTYDGIILAGDSDDNLIQGNKIVPADSAGNQTRYGINIAASTCDNNAVFANYLGDSSEYGTADSVDSGTGTILAAAGGSIGGQFAY